MIWEKGGRQTNLCMYLSNNRVMEGAKGGWLVVTIIFYKQELPAHENLSLKKKLAPVGGFGGLVGLYK